jgi:CMP-N-acetylneuraminic acid synthetase/spore coat polysaccharide biosynthesis predicted glycosyltransferase SpsG
MKKKINQTSRILIIIAARGGSKGIPRKNLRLLNGYPLIYYAIKNSLASSYKPDVYLTSEDDEILTIAQKFGAKIHKRPETLSDDLTTLDPVILDAYLTIKKKEIKEYDIVATIQPTSPLLSTRTIDSAIEVFIKDKRVDTLISATDDTHLTWRKVDNKYIPNYKERVNRQLLPNNYKETGSFLLTRSHVISKGTRIGENVSLYEVTDFERIDIDNFEDWNLCEYFLRRKNLLFVVTGYKNVGLGHVYNTLSLADSILNHNVYFLVDEKSNLAYDKIRETNHIVYKQKYGDITKDIFDLKPNVVINDILDTSREYIRKLKSKNMLIINFEDIGEGAKYADLVINAMYPEEKKLPNHYYGKDYFCLKNDFQFSGNKSKVNKEVSNVLVTFGGVDPNNYTLKVVDSIYDYCLKNNIEIHVAAGLGYKKFSSLKNYPGIKIYQNIHYLSELVYKADIVFTSAGRTTFEISSIGIPAIVLCQNEREATHFFASEEFGFINLGLGYNVSRKKIVDTFRWLSENYKKRSQLNKIQRAQKVRNGRDNVLRLINSLIYKK